MSVSLEYIQLCSTQTGYAISPLEKIVRLGEIAADIARHPCTGLVEKRLKRRVENDSPDLDFSRVSRVLDGKDGEEVQCAHSVGRVATSVHLNGFSAYCFWEKI